MHAKVSVAVKLATVLCPPLLTLAVVVGLAVSRADIAQWVLVVVAAVGTLATLGSALLVGRALTAPVTQGHGGLDAPGALATDLESNLGELYVQLTRRNQALLEEQIDFIDELEAGEADPEQLERLFHLDHLATRMRRSTESLMTLAGVQWPPRGGPLVTLSEMVRIALSEVCEYPRVRVGPMDAAVVSSMVAVDGAHLVAELLENATRFSPPDTDVEVTGTAASNGDYHVVIVDEGSGFGLESLARANARLANPPALGVEIGPALGFAVVAHLARRHGMTVQVSNGPDGGVVATVCLPAAVASASPMAVSGASGNAPARHETLEDLGPTTLGSARGMSSRASAPIDVTDHESEHDMVLFGSDGPLVTRLPSRSSVYTAPSVPGEEGPANPTRIPDFEPPEDLARGAGVERGGGVELLGHGPERLRSPAPPSEPEATARLGSLFSTGSMASVLPLRPTWPEVGPSTFSPPEPLPAAPTAPADGSTAGETPLPQRRPSAGLSSSALATTEATEHGVTGGDGAPGAPEFARLSPREQLRAMTRGSDVVGDVRATGTQRSPEEVRRMLSRYRTGLERGRSARFVPASSEDSAAVPRGVSSPGSWHSESRATAAADGEETRRDGPWPT